VTDPNPPAALPLRIERTFAASPPAVFDAWTSVEVLRRWWAADRDWETTVADVDLRVGGRLRLVMRTPEGAEYGGEGRYVELTRPTRLAFTWRWDDPAIGGHEQLVEVEFHENPDRTTTVLLINSGLSEAEREDHREGWELSFDNLDDVLAARDVVEGERR
jgi:uncharacterized protein YndB with AHSA1/START domain